MTKRPHEISLYDIICIMEGKAKLPKHFPKEDPLADDYSSLDAFYQYMSQLVEDNLKHITFEMLIRKSATELTQHIKSLSEGIST